MPWVANVLLNGVLSHTLGNFLAEYTLNTSLKQDAKIGARPVLTLGTLPSRRAPPRAPTLTKENRNLS